MKKILRIVLMFVLAAALMRMPFISAAAEEITAEAEETADMSDDDIETGSCGDNVIYELDKSTGVLTISGSGEIPDYVYGTSPFYNNELIKEVIIEEGVTAIGSSPFAGCRNLTAVTLPESMTFMHGAAFAGCSSLFHFSVASLESWLNMEYDSQTIGWSEEFHFYTDGKEITEITIPESITSIKDHAFYGWVNLQTVMIPDTVKHIGDYAFCRCSRLSNVMISEGVETIGIQAFRGCSGLAAVTLPDSITSIGSSAFYECIRLREFTIPPRVTRIESSLFYGCTRLTDITLPEGITRIGSRAFDGCTGITEILLPEGITSIGENAFYRCTGLTGIVLPNSLQTLENGAFANCSNLASVDFPEEMIRIGNQAFSYCSSLSSIVLPEGLTEIGFRSFDYCSGLTDVTIPEGVTEIGDSAFFSCTKLRSITIPESLHSVGRDSFFRCRNLRNVHVASLEAWLNLHQQQNIFSASQECHLFADGKELTEIILPDGMEKLDSYAFAYCVSLKNVTLPDSLMTIGEYAFYGCRSLDSITIPDDVTDIGARAFVDCQSLTGVILPEGMELIRSGTFQNCDALQEVYIPVSVTDIENNAFNTKQNVTVYYGGTADDWDYILIGSNNHFADPISFSEGIILSVSSLTMLTEENVQLQYRVIPANLSGNVSWTSSNPKVASIDADGRVSALTYGKAVITASVKTGDKTYQKTCAVQTRYYDVADSSKYYFTPVYWAADQAITNGYGNVYFGTDENCTREQMITFLWRQAGKPSSKLKTAPFTDMDDPGVYYYKAVLWAYEKGITKGYSSGEYAGMFGVGLPVTREDTVTFIYRMAGQPAVSAADQSTYSFPDVESGAYYRKPIAWAAKNGITKGYSSGEYAGMFGVGLNVLRQDIVTFLYRYARLK